MRGHAAGIGNAPQDTVDRTRQPVEQLFDVAVAQECGDQRIALRPQLVAQREADVVHGPQAAVNDAERLASRTIAGGAGVCADWVRIS